MAALALAIAALVALVVLVALEMLYLRRRPKTRLKATPRGPRRMPLLEEYVAGAVTETKEQFGEIFVGYRVWRSDRETRLELQTAPPWRRMSEFTRCLVVRHLWRALESAASGAVVVVDLPPQRWAKEEDAVFRDRGVDLWRTSPYSSTAPQLVKAP